MYMYVFFLVEALVMISGDDTWGTTQWRPCSCHHYSSWPLASRSSLYQGAWQHSLPVWRSTGLPKGNQLIYVIIPVFTWLYIYIHIHANYHISEMMHDFFHPHFTVWGPWSTCVKICCFFVQKVPNYEISRSPKGTQLQMLKDFPRVLVNVGRCWGLFGHLRQIKAKQIFDLGHDTKHTMEIII